MKIVTCVACIFRVSKEYVDRIFTTTSPFSAHLIDLRIGVGETKLHATVQLQDVLFEETF